VAARAGIDARMPIDWSRYREIDAQTMAAPARTDHSFTWETIDPMRGGAHLRVTATVAGSSLASWRRTIEFPKEFLDRYSARQTSANFASIGVALLSIALWILALILFAIRFRASEVSVRNGLLVASILMALMVVYYTDVLSTLADSELAEALDGSNLALYLNLGIQIFFVCLGFFFVWVSGESHSRDLWPAKLRTFDGLFARYFAFTDLGRGILRGFALGFGQLGLWYAGAFALTRTFDLWPGINGIEQQQLSATTLALAPWPPLAPFTYAAQGSLMATAYLYLLSQTLLTKLTKHFALAAAIVLSLSSALYYNTTTLHAHWGTMASAIGPGLLAFAFFYRYDLFSVWIGQFVLLVVPYLAMFVAQPNGTLLSSGISGFAILALGLVFGLWIRLNGRTLRNDQIEPKYVRYISERERLKLELDIARRAQLQMLPRSLPNVNGLDVAAFSEPATQVGGDYFDFFELDDRHLGFAVGDVSGKGMPAALYMTMLKGSLQAQANRETGPAAILSRVNRMFRQSAEANTFVTLTYGMIDIANGLMTFARAGHNPMVVYRPSAQIAFVLQPPGIGIGLEKGEIFDRVLVEERFRLESGDIIVLYTDGLTEGRNVRSEAFGNERLMALIKSDAHGSAEALLDTIRAGYHDFVGRAEPHDDLTCLVILVK
jgi:serine phosphatase RsbU (regulator of sigma subunit)